MDTEKDIMPSDLVLRAVSSAEPARAASRMAGPAVAAPALPAVSAPVTPNPRLRLDGSLGMVVLEFRGSGGEVANTIPSPREIAAYRAAAMSDAPVPIGVQPRGAATAEAAPASVPAPDAAPAPEPAPTAG
jgi:hypothetical protein